MLSRKTYLIISGAAFLLISTVLGFTAWLNILSFQQNYTGSRVSSYALVGKGIAGKIEYALKYGKPFDNFLGMRDLLVETQHYLPEIENVWAVMPDGRIVAALHEPFTNRQLHPALLKKLVADQEQFFSNYFSTAQGPKQHVIIPIFNHGKWNGSIDLIFSRRIIHDTVDRFRKQLVQYLLWLSLAATFVFLCLFRFLAVDDQGRVRQKALRISLITVLTLAQITYGYLNYHLFQTGYQKITTDNAVITSKIIRNDIEAVIDKGVTYGELYHLDNYLTKITGLIPEIAAIRLTDPNNRTLAASAGASGNSWQKAAASDVYANLLKPDVAGQSGKLKVLLSRSNINAKIRDVLLDAATILAVSFFVMLELTLFFMMIFQRKNLIGPATETTHSGQGDEIRSLAFITYQAMFFTAAFVPVMMKTFHHPLAGLSNEIALGLPVSAEMLCGLIATITAGYWVDRKGWRATFAAGLVFFVLGTVLSGVTSEPVTFIVARGLAGIGTGLLVLAMRIWVIAEVTDAARNSGIAALNAGAMSGINCGVVTGAMLADRIGFAGVFLISGGMILFSLYFLRQKPAQHLQLHPRTNSEPQGSFGKFFFNTQVLMFLGLVLIPLAICTMFLNYYFPLFANRIGVSASNIGRAFLLNGLCPILLGPVISKFFERKLGAGRSMLVAAVLTGAAILVFAYYGSLTAALAAIVALGVADSFGTAAQVNYFMNLKAVRQYGVGRSIGFFGLAGKLGSMLGPMAFGGVAFLGLAPGVGVIGGAVLLLIGIFAAVARNSIKEQANDEWG